MAHPYFINQVFTILIDFLGGIIEIFKSLDCYLCMTFTQEQDQLLGSVESPPMYVLVSGYLK